MSIEVLPLPPRSDTNLNDRSVGLVITRGEFRAFFSGDSEKPELQYFLDSGAVPDVTLLKVPYHGSDDAFSEAFLSVSRPEVIVISVGVGNGYGHPGMSALYGYHQFAEYVLRTDVDGDITVSGNPDGSYTIAADAH